MGLKYLKFHASLSIVRDGGGTITTVELGQVMRTFGWTPTEMELQDMIGVIDQDENGCISFDEFVWLMSQAWVNILQNSQGGGLL